MTTATFTPAATRFVWKEYRMLRGLWLAVAALALAEQWLSRLVSMPRPDLPEWLFATALAAAALYAVGAAAVLFAVEHEDETYSFLSGLPTTWLPVFAGKLFVAIASTLALAITLLFTGFALAGSRFPNPYLAGQLTGLFGIAILEALAWGTLFSIVLRQPLLAALLAIFAASASVTLLINVFVGGTTPTLVLASYAHVATVRLLLVVAVALIDAWLARRWWPPGALGISTASASAPASALGLLTRIAGAFRRSIRPLAYTNRHRAQATSYSRTNVVTHLLWQSLRQSWATIMLMLGIVAFCCFTAILTLGITDPHKSYEAWMPLLPFAFALVATALFTSTVFYADQRGNQYRFLAEHAARPRYVWLCRLTTWSLAIVLVLALVAPVLGRFWSAWIREFGRQIPWDIRNGSWWGSRQFSRYWNEITAAARGTMFSLWGIATGFAIGQLCSMIFRRALVAGFAAVFVAVLAMAWGGILWAWELPCATFLLPLVLSQFAATWLRAPDWIVDRNHVRGWTKVAAAIALPSVFALPLLPPARSVTADAQLTNRIVTADVPFVTGIPEWSTDVAVADAVADWVTDFDLSTSAEARANADRLLQLSDLVADPPRPTRDNPDVEPTDEQWAKWREERVALNRDVIEQAVEISHKDCRFPPWEVTARGSQARDFASEHMFKLVELVSWAGEIEAAKSQLDRALEYYLAALRLLGDVQRGQPTRWSSLRENTEPVQRRLVDWAGQKGQTSERIRGAILRLTEIYPDDMYASTASLNQPADRPHPALVANYVLLRDVLTEKRLPISFDGNRNYLAYVANQLPFERARALRVLDYLLVDEVDQWLGVRLCLDQQRLHPNLDGLKEEARDKVAEEIAGELRRHIVRAYDRSYGWPDLPPDTVDPPYSWLRTTYLLRTELGQLDPFGWFLQRCADAEVARWGLKLQLALVAYRIDHGSYPDNLGALAPDYLPLVPIDPYSGRPFEYRPAGLDRELQQDGYASGIEPNTPVLWSVGLGNAQPKLFAINDGANQQAYPDALPHETLREEYRLHSERGVPYVESQLFFPLPK